MSNSNSMVAHLWAQRDKSRAQSSNGNMSFEGPTLYSYSTPIARFHDVPRKGTAVLVTSRRYSITTSGKHMPGIWQSLSSEQRANTFVVPHVRPVLIGGREHKENLAHLVGEYKGRAASVQRMRDYYGTQGSLADELDRLAEKARSYAHMFKLRAPRFDPVADAARVFAKRAERDTPAAIAKREAARVKREERNARIAADRVGAWRRGELHSLNWNDLTKGALLRVRGNRLETSQGATVPLADAIRVYKFVKLCRERGEGWQRNGRSLSVGQFSVDAVYPGGDFKAGCHLIRWPEIEAAAIAAGVLDVAAEDTRSERAAA